MSHNHHQVSGLRLGSNQHDSHLMQHHNGLLTSRQKQYTSTPSTIIQQTASSILDNLFVPLPNGYQAHDTTQSCDLTYDQEQCQSPMTNNNCSSQDLLNKMIDFNPEEMNFSEIQALWLRKNWLDILFRVAFVAPVVLLGIVGNLVIIYSMCKSKPFRSKPTNIFILNMAIADLLTTMVCPIAALFTDIYQFYVLGSFICRFEGFVKSEFYTYYSRKSTYTSIINTSPVTCLLVSSYSLIVLSLDWLLCVVQPCRTRISIKQSWIALTTIWITSVLMASPLFVWRKLRQRQWRDLVEVWCCELIQYTKYYWVVITFFLIYLPTFIMTIVLVIILAKMDKYEAKLRRSCVTSQSNQSLSINIKYRRRIVKILCTYLLTSIICWTPLQFTIIYRHFRTEPIPSPWFFELAFFSQISASLTAAMNPIIFGFLSQPFRRIVTKSLMFKFLDKVIITNGRNSENPRNDGMNNNNNNNARHLNNHHYRPHHGHDQQQAKQAVTNHQTVSSKRSNNQQVTKFTRTSRHGSRTNVKLTSLEQQPNLVPTSLDINNKRVSFNTSATISERQPNQQQVSIIQPNQYLGQVNSSFVFAPEYEIDLDTRKQADKTDVNELVVNQRKRINTTSFIQGGHDLGTLSFVSMDSVNIEENLCGNTVSEKEEDDLGEDEEVVDRKG